MKKALLIVCILLISSNSFAGECTKDEIMKMINAGYSKAEVDDICNKLLKDPMCCCAKEYYKTGLLFYDRKHAKYEKTINVWEKADDCDYYRLKNGFILKNHSDDNAPDYYVEGKCSSANNCGR